MPPKNRGNTGKEPADEPEKIDVGEKGVGPAGSGGRLSVVSDPDQATVAMVRPIRRELGRYSGMSRTETRTEVAAPFRGNVGECIRGALGSEVNATHIRLFGDGMLCPYFRESLNRMGMVKGEHDESRRYMMEGSVDAVTRAMQTAGYNDFAMNEEGVRALVGHLVRQLLERQDRLVETGPRFSPVKASHDQASRLPAILDYHRWRVTVLPNLGPQGYVRITGADG